MKKLTIIITILCISFIGCSEDLIDDSSRGTLRGTVRTEFDNEPLENVKITTTPSTLTVYTNEQGEFEILESMPLGDYSVRADLRGYVTEVKAITISASDQEVSIDFEMVTDDSMNQPPTTPELISPPNLATNVPTDVTLKWESTDPDDDPITYKVLLSNNKTNTRTEFTDIQVDSLELQDLFHSTTYTWQVVASDGINEDVYSSSFQFTTAGNSEFRYHYVRKENDNYVIYSTDLEENIKITESTTSSWRPMKHNIANKLAFLRTTGGQTHLMTSELDGSNAKKISNTLINGFRQDQLNFAWHSDGSRFLYPSFNQLFMVNHDGTGEHVFYKTQDGQHITKVAWSEDGSKVAVVTNNVYGYEAKIIIIEVGIGTEIIFDGVDGAVGGLDWNTQGTKLLFTHDVSGYQSSSYRQLDTRIFIYDFTDDSITDVSEENKPDGTVDIDPKFSPNDAQIIFMNMSNDGISERSIYTMDVDGSNREILIQNGEMPDYK